jgi:hypothetical protein
MRASWSATGSRASRSITTVWPQALVQACVLHLIRNTFRYASRRYCEQMAKDLRPVYTAPTEKAAEARFEEFTATWGGQYPAIVALWRNAWSEFVPFLDYDVEIRKVICSTDEIVNPLPLLRGVVVVGSHFSSVRCGSVGSPARSWGQGGAPGRTNDLGPGEDRRRFGRRWTWFDPVAKCRVLGLSALPRRVAPGGQG